MNARVKATGEIVDGNAMVSFQGDDFYLKELEAIQDDPDYWTSLEHTYAGMAMQGMIANICYYDHPSQGIVEDAIAFAHALVEKMKEVK